MKEPQWLSALNNEQKEAVLHEKEPLLILAGAGSGKTRVITTRIAYLVEKLGFNPWSILAVTFTNKAAAEMRERVESLVPSAEGAMIRTFHSFGAWLLRRNGAPLGLKSSFSIYDDDDTIGLLKTLFEHLPRNELRLIARNISRAKDECLSPEDNLSHISADHDFPRHYKEYEERLRQIGNADFGDLIYLSRKLLAENPEVKTRLQQRFQVVLVDEYQDSNKAQFQLLQELVAPGTWLCVVGDDDQSIYRFRGAEVENILGFQNHFPGTKVIKLEENYRSTGHILAVASHVVAHNEGRLGKNLWTRQEEGIKPQLSYLADQNEEAEFCARQLADGNLSNSAILYRTNAQSRIFESVFRKHHISYRLVGTTSFYSREEVKDSLAYLGFLSNPADEIAFRRLINKPSRGIGAVSLNKILKGDGTALLSVNLEEALTSARTRIRGKAAKGVVSLIELFEKMKDLMPSQENLGQFLKELISESGLFDHYREQDKVESTQRVKNLEELVSAASDYPSNPEGLAEFLELIELDQASLEEEEHDINRVTLITMHNTKGLEFDRVFITGLEDGLFPRGAESDDEEEIEEERRLFYVSITRARKELYLTSCRRRMLYGRTEQASPSRFLKELPEDHIETIGDPPSAAGVPESDYPPGTRIYHEDYGVGEVIRNMENGGHLVIQVAFETGHSMTFLPEFSGYQLEKIGR
ncbi:MULTISPECIES: ATP-dependent helicase [unclassified Oceanispirochaeta]|uniref:ATP-dependent helicase n=1 Tax=unclassified Oceanispirochaeta TaxID=2635722 RepID=UPI000E09A534|nr:UvrD-helicase domain-containing protein [Oceanispirochaeta sp. M1]MBF9014176.1 UvrD-helicase domain-containing protein [Oceanispirochaeta sp. M2]NPD70666.1 UvrD-helicase domain-containing protein [Oceanispirochaeta sp. M1]RDG34427.1 DNA helicase UvrD [Oceanispirochaeta sp. M1]